VTSVERWPFATDVILFVLREYNNYCNIYVFKLPAWDVSGDTPRRVLIGQIFSHSATSEYHDDEHYSTSIKSHDHYLIYHTLNMGVPFDYAADRPEHIEAVLNGLDRYNPETTTVFQDYVQSQCENQTYDCYANLALLKLYVHTSFEQHKRQRTRR